MSLVLSCGVLVTDGRCLLIGHATGTARWDIPKGIAEPGEEPEGAAQRELLEETGLHAPDGGMVPLGRTRYRPGKDLALFLWLADAMPDPSVLRCRSTFTRGGRTLPELDRFACPPWAEALTKLAGSMTAVLAGVARERSWL